MQWHTQSGNITTNLEVKVHFISFKLNVMNVVMWKCHVDDSDKGRYNIILEQDILTDLGSNLIMSEHVIEADDK